MDNAAEVHIPEDRIGALIGREGKAKKRLEAQGECEIDIDSSSGKVVIESDDSLNVYFMKEVVRAVGRGFNPSTASLILKKDYLFEVLDITEYGNEKQVPRLKGRVIGTNGKARETIEDLTETHISVYGKAVSIVGRAENMGAARRAVQALLNGGSHSAVYKRLEEHKQRRERERMLNF
jgi:ribosomal RNA assembly protein